MSFKGWNNSTVYWTFALYEANLSLISNILYGPQNMARSNF